MTLVVVEGKLVTLADLGGVVSVAISTTESAAFNLVNDQQSAVVNGVCSAVCFL